MKKLVFLILLIPLLTYGQEVETLHRRHTEEKEGLLFKIGSDTPFSGIMIDRYWSGQKRAEGYFKDGKREGLFTGWHENGQKSGELYFKDGKEEGLHTQWHENGQKRAELYFKDGKQEGLFTGWHENGQKQVEEVE